LNNVNANYYNVLQHCLSRCNFNHYKTGYVWEKNKRIKVWNSVTMWHILVVFPVFVAYMPLIVKIFTQIVLSKTPFEHIDAAKILWRCYQRVPRLHYSFSEKSLAYIDTTMVLTKFIIATTCTVTTCTVTRLVKWKEVVSYYIN